MPRPSAPDWAGTQQSCHEQQSEPDRHLRSGPPCADLAEHRSPVLEASLTDLMQSIRAVGHVYTGGCTGADAVAGQPILDVVPVSLAPNLLFKLQLRSAAPIR